MATLDWGGGSGEWNTTDTTHWYSNVGRTILAGVVPTSADNVIFDSTSNATAYAVTIALAGVGTSANCLDISISGPAAGLVTITSISGSAINVYGSWFNAAAGPPGVAFSSTPSCSINFLATTTGKTFTTNNVTLGAMSVNFNGVGGYWTLGSDLTITAGSSPSILAGTFDTGSTGYAMTLNSFVSSNTLKARAIKLNNSTISCSGTSTISLAATNLTLFDAGTSTINIIGAAVTFVGGSQTFYNVNFNSTAASIGTISITGANTFNNLNVTTTTLQKIITLSADQTVKGTLTLGATNTAQFRMSVVSDIVTIPRTLAVANLATLADVDFRNITAAVTSPPGTATLPWTGTRIGNCLGNSNISFATAADKYWYTAVGGGGSWASSTATWALASGGPSAVANFPLPQDTVYITNTGLNDAATITINTNADIGSLDMSMRGLDMTLNLGNTDPKFYGNVSTGGAAVITGSTSPTFSFLGQGLNNNLNAGNLGLSSLIVNCPNGSLTLQTSLTVQLTAISSGTVNLTGGTFDINGNTLTAVAFTGSNTLGTVRNLTQASGIINITGGAGSVWNTTAPAGLSYTTTPDVNFTYAGSSGSRTIATADGLAYNGINANITAGTDAIIQSGAVNNLDFTGFSGALSNSVRTIYGNLTLSVGMTVTTGTSATTFDRTGTQTITSNNRAVNFPATFLGVGTTNCLDALALGTKQLILAGGALNLAAGTTSTVGSFVTAGVTMKYLGSTTAGVQATISDTSGTNFVTYLTIKDSNATGGATWDAYSSATNGNSGNNTGWDFPPSVTVPVTGTQVIGYIGNLGATGTANVYPSGAVGYGQIGYPLIWGLVNNVQTPNWQQIVS